MLELQLFLFCKNIMSYLLVFWLFFLFSDPTDSEYKIIFPLVHFK